MPTACEELLSAVRESGPEILMSRKHCHAKNLSSIVVKNDNGRLLRAFLAWPGHELGRNYLGGELTVGIHDHRYDLSLKLIHGDVRSTQYQVANGGVVVHEWSFKSGGASGPPVATKVRNTRIDHAWNRWLNSDGWFNLDAFELHTVDCRNLAAWWVREGEHQQDVTRLFTTCDTIDTTGLYQPFASRDEVIEHVEEWCRLCEGAV